jgi:hypothetical protein
VEHHGETMTVGAYFEMRRTEILESDRPPHLKKWEMDELESMWNEFTSAELLAEFVPQDYHVAIRRTRMDQGFVPRPRGCTCLEAGCLQHDRKAPGDGVGVPCTCDKSTCPVHGSITVRMTAGPQHMLHDHLLDAVEKLISHTVTLTGLPESDIRMALISTLREKR